MKSVKTRGLTGYEIFESLRNEGMARIHLPARDIVDKAMSGFVSFLAEPVEYRRMWTLDLGRETETGYLPRDKPVNKMTGYSYDHKDVFHVSPGISSRLIENGVALQQYEAWLSSLSDLYDKSLDLGIRATREIANMYPNLSISDSVEKATRQRNHVLRLLHYHMKRREGGLIGLGHKDESFLTIHVADNFPGLKVGEEGNTYLVTTSRDVSLIYPGKKAEQITKGDIRALWHEIVDTRHELCTPNQEMAYQDMHRMAIVFFLDIQL